MNDQPLHSDLRQVTIAFKFAFAFLVSHLQMNGSLNADRLADSIRRQALALEDAQDLKIVHSTLLDILQFIGTLSPDGFNNDWFRQEFPYFFPQSGEPDQR